MTTYSIVDESGETRLRGTIVPAPGGGTQAVTVTRYPFAFDTPGLTAAGGPILLATSLFQIASNQLAAFAPGATFTVVGSSFNDGTYTVASATSPEAGAVAIVPVQPIPDSTADGSVVLAQALDVYAPSVDEIILAVGCRIPSLFDGVSASLEVGWSDDVSAIATVVLGAQDHAVDAHLSRTDANWGGVTLGVTSSLYYFTDTTSVQVTIDNGGGSDPLNTTGEGELILVTLATS